MRVPSPPPALRSLPRLSILYSWAGMIPGTFLYVYIGYVGKGVVTAGDSTSSVLEKVLKYGVAPVVTLAVVIVVTIVARRELAKHTVASEEAADDDNERT